jgi:hypothetical protein
MECDMISYSLFLRGLHIRIYRKLRSQIPIPGRPAKLVIATSVQEYGRISKGSRIVQGAAAFTIPGRNLIVLNAPKMMDLQANDVYPHCCTITHEYIHIAMEHTDDDRVEDAVRFCRRRRSEISDIVMSQGWDTKRVDELITICCEWVYCHHPRPQTDECGMMTELGITFSGLLGWVIPDA